MKPPHSARLRIERGGREIGYLECQGSWLEFDALPFPGAPGPQEGFAIVVLVQGKPLAGVIHRIQRGHVEITQPLFYDGFLSTDVLPVDAGVLHLTKALEIESAVSDRSRIWAKLRKGKVSANAGFTLRIDDESELGTLRIDAALGAGQEERLSICAYGRGSVRSPSRMKVVVGPTKGTIRGLLKLGSRLGKSTKDHAADFSAPPLGGFYLRALLVPSETERETPAWFQLVDHLAEHLRSAPSPLQLSLWAGRVQYDHKAVATYAGSERRVRRVLAESILQSTQLSVTELTQVTRFLHRSAARATAPDLRGLKEHPDAEHLGQLARAMHEYADALSLLEERSESV